MNTETKIRRQTPPRQPPAPSTRTPGPSRVEGDTGHREQLAALVHTEPEEETADCPARMGSTMTATMVAADTAQIKRLTDFASDVLQLAAKRPDLELRELIDEVLLLRGDDDDG